MAKSKAKNLKKKKKVSTYDDKLIKIIAASVIGIVAVLVAVIGIVSYNNSYICKVDGKRVMTYEYKTFLGVVMEEMQTEYKEDLEDEEEFDSVKFWTDAKIAEAEKEALNRVCDWKANYLLAKDAGYGMNIFERNKYYDELDEQLAQTYSYFLQQYNMTQNTFSYDAFISYMTNGMDLSQYRKYALQDRVISDYETALKDKYSVGEDEIKKKYEAEEDTFRKVVLNTYAITLPEIPELPTVPSDIEDKYEKIEDSDTKDAAFVKTLKDRVALVEKDIEAEVFPKDSDKYKAANDYVAKLNELVEALETSEEIKTKMKGIYDQLASEKGKYTGEGFKEDTTTSSTTVTSTAKPLATAKPSETPSTDAPGTNTPSETPSAEAVTDAVKGPSDSTESATTESTATPAPSDTATVAPSEKPSEDKKDEADKDETKYKEYKDATLADLAATDGDIFTDTKGKYEFTAAEIEKIDKDSDEYLKLFDFAMALEWNDDKTEIVSKNEEFTVTTKEYNKDKDYGEGKIKTQVVMFADEKYVYIVECVGIKDLETNKEPWSTGTKGTDGKVVKETSCVKTEVDAAIREDKLEAELKTEREKANFKRTSEKAKNKQKIADEVVPGFKSTSQEA